MQYHNIMCFKINWRIIVLNHLLSLVRFMVQFVLIRNEIIINVYLELPIYPFEAKEISYEIRNELYEHKIYAYLVFENPKPLVDPWLTVL